MPKTTSSITFSAYVMHSAELNIARNFRLTIVKAFTKHPQETYEQIAIRLGISDRSLYSAVKRLSIDTKAIRKNNTFVSK